MYTPVDPKVNFPKLEESILELWTKNNIFKKSIEQREGCEEYVFYDGPPPSQPASRTLGISSPAPSRTSSRATKP